MSTASTTTAAYLLTPSYILKEGLTRCNINEDRQAKRSIARNVVVFKSFFGRHPLHLARVWRDLQEFGIMTREEAEEKDSFLGFLAANNFLKLYESNDIREARFNVCADNLQKLTWHFIDLLEALFEKKIKCPSVWPARLGASVDGTQTRTNEPRDKDVRRNPVNYAYKHNFAGLNHQIVLSLWTQEVWYARVGDPGRTHDMTAIRQEFISMVPEGCRVIADNGYQGKTAKEKSIFAVNNNLDDEDVKIFKGHAKARQEQFNSRLKNYKCFKDKFIHGIPAAKKCFKACIVLAQYAIEDTSSAGEPLPTL